MADPNAANLDELKRLLRLLDKALPEVPAAGLSPAGARVEPARADDAVPAPKTTAVRTIVLAGVVSLLVSVSVVMLFIQDTPVRRLAAGADTAKTNRPAAEKKEAAGLAVATATLQPDLSPPAQTAPATSSPPNATADAAPPAIEAVQAPVASTPAEPPAAEPAPNAPAGPEATTTQAAEVSTAAIAEPANASVPGSDALGALDATQLLRRGLALLSRGNINAAQLLLERAADLGNGEAAFALAGTYDAAPGAPRHGTEVRPDSERALRWYTRADELGVAAAGARLAALKVGDATSSR